MLYWMKEERHLFLLRVEMIVANFSEVDLISAVVIWSVGSRGRMLSLVLLDKTIIGRKENPPA